MAACPAAQRTTILIGWLFGTLSGYLRMDLVVHRTLGQSLLVSSFSRPQIPKSGTTHIRTCVRPGLFRVLSCRDIAKCRRLLPGTWLLASFQIQTVSFSGSVGPARSRCSDLLLRAMDEQFLALLVITRVGPLRSASSLSRGHMERRAFTHSRGGLTPHWLAMPITGRSRLLTSRSGVPDCHISACTSSGCACGCKREIDRFLKRPLASRLINTALLTC